MDYANDADGTCQECGADTAEEYHALCGDCYAEQEGWTRRREAHGLPVPAFPADDRWRVAWMAGYRAGWAAALADQARRAA